MLTPRQTTLLCARAIRAAGRPFAFRFRGLRPQNTPVLAARHRRVTKWCVALDATVQNVKTPNSPRPIPSRADPEKGEPVFGKRPGANAECTRLHGRRASWQRRG